MAQILTIWRKEVVDNIRDKRTLWTSLLMPVLLMPAILVGSFKMQEAQVKSAEQKVAKVAVVNAEQAVRLVDFLGRQEKLSIVPVPSDPGAAVESNTVNVILTVPTAFESNLQAGVPTEVTLTQKSTNFDSTTAAAKVTVALQGFNQLMAQQRLTDADLSPTVLTSVLPKTVDLADAAEVGGYFLGLLLPMFIVVFAIIGGMYIAIDVSAGEKERKTLEALLVTPVARMKIVIGKFLAVASTAVVTIILSLGSLYAAFKVVPPPDLGGTPLVINLTPSALMIMLGIGVILAIMFAGLLLSVAIFAKSYKEAQNYISPFYLLAVIPVSIVNSIPGFKPTIAFFLIPGVNAVFVMKEALVEVYDPVHLLTTVVSLLVFAVVGIVAASKIYSREGILFRD